MFALTRRVNESIVIPVHDITIHVTQINDRVTLAFDAPDDVRILRGELYDPSKPVEPRPAPLKVPAPASVFVILYSFNYLMSGGVNVGTKCYVNRARAIAMAKEAKMYDAAGNWTFNEYPHEPHGVVAEGVFGTDFKEWVRVIRVPVE